MSVTRETLERRVKRLAHLIEISAPPQLISKEVLLVVQAAMFFCPEEAARVFVNWFAEMGRRDGEFCQENADDETIKIEDER